MTSLESFDPQWVECDGNEAAAYMAYACSDVSFIYPITPSTQMAELSDKWAVAGIKNIFGEVPKVSMMQSEGGVAGATHGSNLAGALTSTFTASQGLLLMIPNMYHIAGEHQATVLHVASRQLGTHGAALFCDHSDVMACRQTGFCMLASNSVQEASDLALIAHIAAVKTSLPFLHFFDGLRTSHEFQKIRRPTYDQIGTIYPHEAAHDYRHIHSMSNLEPRMTGSGQNNEIWWQVTELGARKWLAAADIIDDVMAEAEPLLGHRYRPFEYIGAVDAENVIVLMGSGAATAAQTVKRMLTEGHKVGVIVVRLFRPFGVHHFLGAVPDTCKVLTVLDKVREEGAGVNPLYGDIAGAFVHQMQTGKIIPKLITGVYGLCGYEFTPAMVKSVFDNAFSSDPMNNFNIGLYDDVLGRALEMPTEQYDVLPEGTIECVFWGMGGDGTIGANRNALTIIGGHTELFGQGYFLFDAKKTGGTTISFLRFGKEPIVAPYLITDNAASYLAIGKDSYLHLYPEKIVSYLAPGGVCVVNTSMDDETFNSRLPGQVKQQLHAKNARLYLIDAAALGMEIGLGSRINNIMQTVFFYLSGIYPFEEAKELLKKAIKKSYSRFGDEVVAMNHLSVDRALDVLHPFEIPAEWATAEPTAPHMVEGAPDCVNKVILPSLRWEGPQLPVSAVTDFERGRYPTGTSRYEKRRPAIRLPVWDSSSCIQCNICSVACPHAAIRPAITTPDEQIPEGWEAIPVRRSDGGEMFRIQVWPEDCLGCGVCAQVCPRSCLEMTALTDDMVHEQRPLAAFAEEDGNPERSGFGSDANPKVLQFKKPYLEFSGACAGCAETPIMRMLTQLFQHRLHIACAVGCCMVWGNMGPPNPYVRDDHGRGPTLATSLFEDNAEVGLGMVTALEQRTARLEGVVTKIVNGDIEATALDPLKEQFAAWLTASEKDRISLGIDIQDRLLEIADQVSVYPIMEERDLFVPKSHWIIGGDGWAYDIDSHGVEHVLASGRNVNILVFDTEVYSNTGGQASKATPRSAVAKFAAGGKAAAKKDLARILMTYGNIYIACVALNANSAQALKAIKEASEYDGPSIVISYCPCIAHGISGGMEQVPRTQKLAVKTGYWPLLRYDPTRREQGLNPLQLDCKPPTEPVESFLDMEVRFKSLKKSNPALAEELHQKLAADVTRRWTELVRLATDLE